MATTQSLKQKALRKALKNLPDWQDYSKRTGIKYWELTIAEMEQKFAELTGSDFQWDEDEAGPVETIAKAKEQIAKTEAPKAKSEPKEADTGLVDGADDEDAILLAQLETIAKRISQRSKAPATDEARVIELIREHAPKPAAVHIKVSDPSGATISAEKHEPCHYLFPALVAGLAAGVNIMLVGPAGSGKTTAAHGAADALGLDFGMTGAIMSAFALTGFIDAQGRTISTEFRRRFTDGGVFLFDEMDASAPQATLAFNASLANGSHDFPDGIVPRHPDFRPIAAVNTYGRGADRVYVGRNQLDGATLDRWVTLDWEYDTGLEAAMVGLEKPSGAKSVVSIKPMTDDGQREQATRSMFEYVQAARAAVDELKIRHVISPRAVLHGSKLLHAGWPKSLVEHGCVWKGIDPETVSKIKAKMPAAKL